MFAPGELIFYGRTGVCRVEAIETMDGQPYYRLSPRYQSSGCVIRTPVEGKVFMRRLLTREEAHALIDRIPEVRTSIPQARSLRELSEHYLASINTHDAAELLAMTMSIYAKQQLAKRDKRRLGAIDERFLREGETLLFGELAAVLDIAPEEVPAYIQARLKQENQ